MAVKEIGDFTKLKNPYTFGVPVRGEDNFFGREQELQLIFDTLENVPRGQKQDMVILGPRRIGKSSLLYRLDSLLKGNQEFVSVYVDIQNIKPRTIRVLFLKILQQIRSGYRQHDPQLTLPQFDTLEATNILADLEFLTFDEDLTRLNEAISFQNLPRLVMMFDEVELLLEFGGLDTLEWFRSLIQSMLYSIFVVAGSEQLYALTQDYGSPFYNIFKTIELFPLSSEAARKLIVKPAAEIGMDISAVDVDKILHNTGNTPYFIQGVCHYLVQELNAQQRYQVYAQDIDKILIHSVDHLSAQFAYIWGTTSKIQKSILYSLAKSNTPQTPQTLLDQMPTLEDYTLSKQEQKDIFDDLEQQQILTIENGYCRFRVPLFVGWILNRADVDEIVQMTEPLHPMRMSYDLRKIRNLLTKGFSTHQIIDLAFYTPEFKDVYELLSETRSKNDSIRILLDYTERRGLLDVLLDRLKDENPRQYEAFQPYQR